MTVERLGLRRGEPVRFRRHDRSRWQDGKVTGLSRDGGLDIADKDGATRTIALDLVLVQAAGPRGARGWEPLLDRATRTEQLSLF